MITLPGWVYWLGLVLAVGGLQQCRVDSAQDGKRDAEKIHADYVTEQERLRTEQIERARAEEKRLQLEKEANEQAIQKDLDAARDDAAAYSAESDRLRQQVDRLRAGAGATCKAIAAQHGQTEPGPINLLADLFLEAQAEAGRMAQEADRAIASGRGCERAYDSLPTN